MNESPYIIFTMKVDTLTIFLAALPPLVFLLFVKVKDPLCPMSISLPESGLVPDITAAICFMEIDFLFFRVV